MLSNVSVHEAGQALHQQKGFYVYGQIYIEFDEMVTMFFLALQ